jgi:hypothetical protein
MPNISSEVQTVLSSYPEPVQRQLLALRDLIFDVAAEDDTIGPLKETLKWGQISYLTPVTRSGSTVRIDAVQDAPDEIGLFVHCQTTLVDTFRARYSDLLTFEGSRCVRLPVEGELPFDAVRDCVRLALTYHRWKKQGIPA